jgi:hypothetical protein
MSTEQENAEHPLLREETDVEEAQEHDSAPPDREPTGQTGSADEQYGGAGTAPDEQPELHRELTDDGDDETQ